MNKTILFLKTIRLPNLIMLALVQYIVCAYFLQVYTTGFWALVSSATIFIALGGYLLNDIRDLEIDRINEKLKWVKLNNRGLAKKITVLFFVIGMSIGFVTSLQTDLKLFFLFVIAFAILVSYAYIFSKYKVIGNILVSALISLSILLCFYLGVEHDAFNRKFYTFSELGVIVYAGLAFLLNWIREIVKDLEDLEGDKSLGRKSLPIVLGQKISKGIVLIVMLFFFALMVFLAIKHHEDVFFKLYLACFLFAAAMASKKLIRATTSKDFGDISTYLKAMMFFGVLLPITNYL